MTAVHSDAPVVGVYMMIDELDRVLYIGASRDVARRVDQHRDKAWWHLVASVETYPMDDWNLALYVERKAIAEIVPEFNVQSNGDVHRVIRRFEGDILRQLSATSGPELASLMASVSRIEGHS